MDAADLGRWRTGYGLAAGAEPIDGDADGDSDVDGNDFLFWQQGLGAESGTPGATAAPEPASAWLLLGAMLAARAMARSAGR